MHLTEEQVQRALHGEAPDASLEEHLATCAACRQALARAAADEAGILALLGSLDAEPPALSADTIAALARGRRPARAGFRWAAALLLASGLAEVAYAVPGSPVRRWVSEFLGSASIPAPEPACVENNSVLNFRGGRGQL